MVRLTAVSAKSEKNLGKAFVNHFGAKNVRISQNEPHPFFLYEYGEGIISFKMSH